MDKSRFSGDIVGNAEAANLQWRRNCFRAFKSRAEHLGTEFLMEFSEWWAVWEPHWVNRGIHDLVMKRWNESGPFADWNVYITTRGESARQSAWQRTKNYGRAPCA